MRIGRVGQPGSEKPVVFVDDENAVDVSSLVSDWSRDSLSSGGFERVRSADLSSLPTIALEGARIGAPVARPTKVICIGLNYRKHAEETGAAIPGEPVVFMKAPDCVVGPFDDIEIPPGSTKTDYEVELAIVIGKRLRYAKNHQEAMDAVLGYTISQDVSEREWQTERGLTWDKGKGFDTFGPVGPWLVTADEIGNPGKLDMWLDVNGEKRQRGNTKTMIFDCATLVAYVSQLFTLNPGDIITTGTPPGVGSGMKPQQFLKAGDVVTLGIQGLGEQRQKIVKFKL